MMTRDSLVWSLAVLGAVLVYLGANPNPVLWTYPEWIQFGAFVVATISGKLSTSPLPHSTEGSAKITPDGK